MDHTPTPWKLGPKRTGRFDHMRRLDWEGGIVAEVQDKDAAFIVRACNSHEVLLAACQMAAGALAMMTPSLGSPDWYVNAIEDAKRDCAAAIANAKEGAE